MKRFGIPILLSAVYVCLLVFVFSSEFGRSNSFFFSDKPVPQTEATAKMPVPEPVLKPATEAETSLVPKAPTEDPATFKGEEAGSAYQPN